MNYSYYFLSVKPDKVEETLNHYGAQGYKMVNMHAVQNVTGVNIDRTPKIETSYKITLMKRSNG